jgi:type II secretory pathway pseudopilin PulG
MRGARNMRVRFMYGRTHKTAGLTLIETTLVVATIALLVGLAVPAVRALVGSFQSEGGTRSVIHAALNSARTMAISRQRYVGVRFQKSCVSDDPADPLKRLLNAPQYMIFITHDDYRNMGNIGNGFRAIEGLEPIKLPDTMNVLDLAGIATDLNIDDPVELNNAVTFSIVFSPSGKLIVRDVRTRNRDGVNQPDNAAGAAKSSMDEVFNSDTNIIVYGRGMFIQDDYNTLGLDEEPSRMSFVICDRSTLRRTYENKRAWTDYLRGLSLRALYVSPYAGDLISAK